MVQSKEILHFLRPGKLAIEAIDYVKLRPLYNALFLNAPSLANKNEIRDFMTALGEDTPFLVDPRSFALALSPSELKNPDSGKLRGSWRYMLDAFGVEEDQLPLRPQDVNAIAAQLAESTVAFELACVPPQSQMNLFSAYNHLPMAIIAPYFRVMSIDDPWFDVNLSLCRETKKAAGRFPVYAVLQMDAAVLEMPDQMRFMGQKCGELPVDGFLLWPVGFHEGKATVQDIIGLRLLIASLKSFGDRPVINMYGGYLSALLYHWGLDGFSHRHDGGERRALVPVRGGPLDVRYYVPAVHQAYIIDSVEGYIKRLGIETRDLFQSRVCDCVICSEVTKGGLDGFIREFGARQIKNGKVHGTRWATELAAFHFMLVRHRELEDIQRSSVDSILKQLAQTAIDYRDPLAFSRGELKTAHLRVWHDGLSQTL